MSPRAMQRMMRGLSSDHSISLRTIGVPVQILSYNGAGEPDCADGLSCAGGRTTDLIPFVSRSGTLLILLSQFLGPFPREQVFQSGGHFNDPARDDEFFR